MGRRPKNSKVVKPSLAKRGPAAPGGRRNGTGSSCGRAGGRALAGRRSGTAGRGLLTLLSPRREQGRVPAGGGTRGRLLRSEDGKISVGHKAGESKKKIEDLGRTNRKRV